MSPVDRSRLPPLGPDLPFWFPPVRKDTRPNGLRVWTVEHRGLPLIALLLLVPAGSAADPGDRPGLAGLTGDMLDEGSGARSALEFHEALMQIGAQLETEVGADAILLTLITLSRFRDRALELLADMAMRPRLDEEDFERVRRLRINRLMQLRNMPPAVADRVFARTIYGPHPYGHLAVGDEQALSLSSLEEVASFYRRAFVPAGTTLIAVGDLDHEPFAAAVDAWFGTWTSSSRESGPAPLDAATVPPPVPARDRLVIVHRTGAAQSELRMGHVATSRSTPDYHALLVLNMVLGGQFVSRINMNLREEKGYTYGARTSFDFRRGPGPFMLQASVQTDATVAAVREVLAELRSVGNTRPVTAQELQLARGGLIRGYPRNFETAEQIARAVAQLALYELPDDYFTEFIPRVTAVDEGAVTAAAVRYLDLQHLATVIVGDRERLGDSLSELELGPAVETAVV